MSKKSAVVSRSGIQGLWIPNAFVSWLGIFHRLSGAAKLTREGIPSSPYITHKVQQFAAFSYSEAAALEAKTKPLRTAREQLLLDGALRPTVLAIPANKAETPEEVRRRRASAKAHQHAAACKHSDRKELAEVQLAIQSAELLAVEELMQVSSVVKAKLSVYCAHAFQDATMFEKIDLDRARDHALELYHQVHNDRDVQINAMIEEEHHEENA